jgi:solute carrier family 35 protein E2
MSIVGLLRGATVVLGLVALEHVPVSFVETIKATAPAFTVLFARIILKERTATPVMLTLFPVVAGLILCSASELRFDTIGFVAAVMNNCADCVQNVMSKRMLTHLKPTQLQFYTSVAALTLQAPFVVRDAGMLIRNWTAPEDEPIIIKGTEKGSLASLGIGKLLLIDAIFYHLQSVSAYCTMGCMSPVSQSVANTLKRALLVWASILYFGNPVTSNGVIGIIMVVSGVFLYNHVRRVNQR